MPKLDISSHSIVPTENILYSKYGGTTLGIPSENIEPKPTDEEPDLELKLAEFLSANSGRNFLKKFEDALNDPSRSEEFKARLRKEIKTRETIEG